MLNQVILIGNVANDPEIKVINGKNVVELTLAIRKDFKNKNNEYETDFIKIKFWEYLATTINDYAKKGQVVCVKGRIQPRKIKVNDTNIEINEIIGEQLQFFGSIKKD